MLAWGENSMGCFHGNGREMASPVELPNDSPTLRSLKVLAVGEYQCCVLSMDGSVTIYGSIGDSSKAYSSSTKITALEALNIADVFAGGSHMFAVTDDGRAYGWGVNNFGQLGWRDNSGHAAVNIPKSVRQLSSKRVVQISCGKQHTLVLLHDGSIYSMGDNSFGQLGIGTYEPTFEPTEISSLRGLPIAQVVATGWHSFCVTISGRVFCWGRNDCGQLGLGDRANRKAPCHLRMLRSHTVKFIAGGDYHSVALTQDGGVFTFGSSSKGQLGHGNISEFEVNPRKVFELMGSVVTQIACGKSHTVAYVPDSGNVFVCGSGERGQLGQGRILDSLLVPTVVQGPWTLPSSSLFSVKEIFACGNQCFVIVNSQAGESIDFRNPPFHRRIWSINSTLCDRVSQISDDGQVSSDIMLQLDCIMGSQSCLNASFLATDHHKTSTKYHGLSMADARLQFAKLFNCGNKRLLQKVATYLSVNMLPSLPADPPDIEALRLYILLPEFKIFRDPSLHDTLLFPFVEKLLHLAEKPAKILDQWYCCLDSDYFTTPIEVCQECIIATIKRGLPPDSVKAKITILLKFMQKLNKVNGSTDLAIVDFHKFYIPELNDLIPLESDYQQWAKTANADFSFCRYPFVFNSKAKTLLLQIDSKYQMHEAFMHARGQNVAAFFGLGAPSERPVIEIEVRRERLVEDAIRAIGNTINLKRPFHVKFVGEDGQDAGGVRKEFFMLILREILDPKYGMFCHYKDSNLLWFSDFGIETDDTYHLIGTLCGLAVYNSTIIDINFPLALYKKLLGVQPSMADFKELDPVVGSSLQQLADFIEDDGCSVEDTFCLDFTITRDHFDTTSCIELVENGQNIPITRENRNQYVSAYLDYVFNRSIRSQFECFKKGFLRVCGGEVLNLFRPEELMEMVVGNQNYNWEELEKKTAYKGEYWRQHQVISWFWEVFHSLKTEEKKDFVRFLTGSSKIPINGLEMVIQPLPFGDDYLPVAHTCFNILDLPRYTRKEALETKLRLAIRSEGFFLA